jgi:hypothetical protein
MLTAAMAMMTGGAAELPDRVRKKGRVHDRDHWILGRQQWGDCCGSAARWNCSASLQTHACAHAPATPRTETAVTLHTILAQRDQDINEGMQFDMPRVRTSCCPANVEGILRTRVMRELPQQR